EWYGERFDLTTSYTFDFDFENITSNSTVKITSNVMAQSFASSSFDLFLNDANIGSQVVESVPNFNQGSFRYSVKGKEKTDVFEIPNYSGSDNLKLQYTYNKNSSDKSLGFLDEVLVEVTRDLSWANESISFRSLASVDNGFSTFQVANANENLIVWNVTDQYAPIRQSSSLSGSDLSFGAASDELQEYIVFDPANVLNPTFDRKVETQNLQGLATPDLLIVTHPNFLSEAKRLAAFRSTNDGLSAAVVTTSQIYNEFSSGKQDVSAIRDFTKHLFDKGGNLKYLLLFGRGSYDYLDIINNNTNYVPIYESRNGLDPLRTYGSDDFYGFLEDDEGQWEEITSGGHTLDIGVGRLPVSSIEEAADVVDKLINYSANKGNYGSWRNVVSFVADDEDGNLHQRQSDQLTQLIDTTYLPYIPNKLYLDKYTQVSKPNGEVSPEASEALNEAIDKGSLIVNFTGHGGETGWMQEQVLDLVMIREWRNKNKLPLFVTATCEFSRHDDPRRVSGGEIVVTNPIGGGIGILSTCRPVNSSSNFELNKAFYNTVFETNNNEPLRLGDIIKNTKNTTSVNQVGNRNFALLGDPSLLLAFPEKKISITSIKNGTSLSDTVNALSKVAITGEITNGVIKESNFNGTLYAVVYDKESSVVTKGSDGNPFYYYDKENVIFRGKASITNGTFNFEFIVPKNISYQHDRGKISLYAVNEDKSSDANGAEYMIIGGTSQDIDIDNQGPDISLYVGDSTNNLPEVASNTMLMARLKDESGISITGYGIENNLAVILDDSIEYIANEFYQSDIDTYQSGWLNFPLKNLTKGNHKITLRAWDTHNNSNESSINFTVLDPNKFIITELYNFPNPFADATSFAFKHNREGDDIEGQLSIMTNTGRVVQKIDFNIDDSRSNVNLGEWIPKDLKNQNLDTGLYLFKLSVRSKQDGAFTERHEKLVFIE
ncbi:type IX secretion system sortase PorU, partial [Fulvivirga sp. RKSG066]|uniref:type IX secretion system sortase PorU n=1 Tax=Fulvivirga aurantia TaxID=2529383 RepID=UPI0012BC693E